MANDARCTCSVVLIATSCFVSVVAAQMFRSGVETVQVTVTVTDANGRLVPGLTREHFEIYEDGRQEPITQFSDKRVPVSLGLLLDISDSMLGQPIDDARAAVDRFVAELLEDGDEAFVATFNHAPRIVTMWKRPPSTLKGSLSGVRPTGGTAIYDALAAAAPLFNSRTHTRAALIVVSDGADTASDRTLQQARDVLRRSDPFVYAIAIDSVTRARPSTRVNPDALREITGPSGGYTEVIRDTPEIGPATERIANELNHQYTLGYNPTKPPDGNWRSIRVRVRDEGGGDVKNAYRPTGPYYARARRGYFSVPRRPRS